MRRQLTDTDMLTAAEKQLAAHRDTRPATRAEATAIAAQYRREEAACRAAAECLRTPLPMPEWHNADTAMQHGMVTNARNLEALHVDALADRRRMSAESWEAIADQPEVAWWATEAALIGRVGYYRTRVEAAGARQ